MNKEEKREIMNQFDNFVFENSTGSCRPRERSINSEDAVSGLKSILDSFNSMQSDKSAHPVKYKDIIVTDEDGKEHDNHYWNGQCYYYYSKDSDGCCDGYRTLIDIVSWRYK